MPENPHEYTVRRWRADPQGMAEFNRFVTLMRDHGWVGSFGASSYPCLDVGAHSYWMMGAPLSITVIINRKLTQHVPGEHPTSATITRGAHTASECLRRAGCAPAWTHPAGARTVARGAVACNPQFSVGRIPAVSLAVALRPREC
ncbi:MAG TPA: hypothetical protein VFY45_14525 [Baekduia sp.]|nr:hypothetical protein [Baekduia sp.]